MLLVLNKCMIVGVMECTEHCNSGVCFLELVKAFGQMC